MTGIMVQTKLQFQAVLDQVFPEYKGVFENLYAEISLKTLQAFPTSESVIKAGVEEITKFINMLGFAYALYSRSLFHSR